MQQTVTSFVARDPETCWRLFTDAAALVMWVPGLRRAEVLAKERGMPAEIHFEFSESLVYTLAYAYDPAAREVRWQPKLGRRDGVSGSMRFDAGEGGTTLTYTLEHGAGRTPSERELGDIQRTVDAFVRWATAAR
ncbi:MAG: SRPBCC family protein [Deltaproteobacteria bacterium]|nr:SRPBCC family protein [Deltaproteobacteria bacterium]MCW5807778.1 SRPBCC family protein [Deltaproteobacteria bacterium]